MRSRLNLRVVWTVGVQVVPLCDARSLYLEISGETDISGDCSLSLRSEGGPGFLPYGVVSARALNDDYVAHRPGLLHFLARVFFFFIPAGTMARGVKLPPL